MKLVMMWLLHRGGQAALETELSHAGKQPLLIAAVAGAAGRHAAFEVVLVQRLLDGPAANASAACSGTGRSSRSP